MRYLIITIAIAGIISFTGCSKGTTIQKPDNTSAMEQKEKTINATPEEIDGIKKTLDAYIEAALKGDSRIAKPAFAETATISYNEDGKLVSSPIAALYDYYDQTGPHHAEYTITAAQVAGNVAVVCIDSKFGDVRFDDMFTMVKDGDDWKIVSKVYHVK